MRYKEIGEVWDQITALFRQIPEEGETCISIVANIEKKEIVIEVFGNQDPNVSLQILAIAQDFILNKKQQAETAAAEAKKPKLTIVP